MLLSIAMLGKILLTCLVIVIAFFVIRQRAIAEQGGTASQAEEKDRESGEFRFMAWSFLVMMVAVAAGMYYYQWRDDHTVLTITLHPDNQGAPISYQVYKYQLGERSFTTVEGTSITVAGSERMEIEGLDE